jgi:phosphoserine phosphatase RsbU/P
MASFPQPRLSLALKMALDLLVVALVPLALVTWIFLSRVASELEASAKQNVQLLSRVTASQIDQMLLDASRFARQLALDDRVVQLTAGGSREAAEKQLVAAATANPDYASLFVVDAKGVALAATNAGTVGRDLSQRAYLRPALEGKPAISGLIVGLTTDVPGVYVVEPVRAGSIVSGVVVVKLDGRMIREIAGRVKVGAAGFAMIVDEEGIVIAHPDEQSLYQSVAALDESSIARIDPKNRFQRDTIGSLDMPELLPLVMAGEGAAAFTKPVEHGREPWVAGLSTMSLEPWRVVVVQPKRQFDQTSGIVARRLAITAGVMCVVASVLALWRGKNLARPLTELSTAARQLSGGDFSARATVSRRDEIGHLATAFNQMVPKLRESVELQRSLDLATKVQQALLPDGPPTIAGLDVFAKSRYCDQTGGDYYDFVERIDSPQHKTMLIAIGDVTGHGIGAALLMCTARAALRTAAQSGGDCGAILTRMNKVLCQESEHGLLMTLTLLSIDPATRVVQYACAAHDAIDVYDPKTAKWTQLAEGFLALGTFDDNHYQQYTAGPIEKGSVLFIGTDGIWEARNDAEEMFGKDRMLAAIARASNLPAKAIGAAVEADLDAYLGKRKIQDDVTYLVVKFD